MTDKVSSSMETRNAYIGAACGTLGFGGAFTMVLGLGTGFFAIPGWSPLAVGLIIGGAVATGIGATVAGRAYYLEQKNKKIEAVTQESFYNQKI